MHLVPKLAVALAIMAASSAAHSATLVHAYDFSNTGGTTAIDLVGSANGTVVGGAVIAGGTIALDGINDAINFGTKIIPVGGDFSVFIRAQILQPISAHTEIIAQGSSGLNGFYIGSGGVGGNKYRLGDAYGFTGVNFHDNNDFHNLLLTNGAGSLKFSIDGATVFSAAQSSFGGTCNTVIGSQFCGISEFFKGSIDTVKIYSGVATYDEASAAIGGVVPEPTTWALMIGGFGMAGAVLRRRRAVAA